MSYAAGRICNYADSHPMELSDWLVRFADPEVREKVRPLLLGGAGSPETSTAAQQRFYSGSFVEMMNG